MQMVMSTLTILESHKEMCEVRWARVRKRRGLRLAERASSTAAASARVHPLTLSLSGAAVYISSRQWDADIDGPSTSPYMSAKLSSGLVHALRGAQCERERKCKGREVRCTLVPMKSASRSSADGGSTGAGAGTLNAPPTHGGEALQEGADGGVVEREVAREVAKAGGQWDDKVEGGAVGECGEDSGEERREGMEDRRRWRRIHRQRRICRQQIIIKGRAQGLKMLSIWATRRPVLARPVTPAGPTTGERPLTECCRGKICPGLPSLDPDTAETAVFLLCSFLTAGVKAVHTDEQISAKPVRETATPLIGISPRAHALTLPVPAPFSSQSDGIGMPPKGRSETNTRVMNAVKAGRKKAESVACTEGDAGKERADLVQRHNVPEPATLNIGVPPVCVERREVVVQDRAQVLLDPLHAAARPAGGVHERVGDGGGGPGEAVAPLRAEGGGRGVCARRALRDVDRAPSSGGGRARLQRLRVGARRGARGRSARGKARRRPSRAHAARFPLLLLLLLALARGGVDAALLVGALAGVPLRGLAVGGIAGHVERGVLRGPVRGANEVGIGERRVEGEEGDGVDVRRCRTSTRAWRVWAARARRRAVEGSRWAAQSLVRST
ncbi:hypothetical protein DFH11DRAFT_1552050 [Phellopilus nigrolimitatus]|nr:hypothetical protein DFH11DRAFT_1552050 [Phellopilus nigrolimitatus]